MAVFVYVLFILTPLLLEGLGIDGIREYTPFFYLIVPLVMRFFTKKTVRFPRRTTIAYGAFLFSIFISTFWFSVDKQISFELMFFFVSLFVVFLFFYNHKIENNEAVWGIVWVAGFLSLYFLATRLFKDLLPATQTEYQAVFPLFGNHNHLGDVLGLVIVGCVYLLFRQKKSAFFWIGIAATPLFFLSFSRSAYVGVLATVGLFYFLERPQSHRFVAKTAMAGFFILTVVFLAATAKEAGKSPVFQQLHGVLSEKLALAPKDFFGGRFIYFQQGIESLYERPLFGLGLGNFEYSSKKYAIRYYETTTDAHNIFLELGVEGGIFALASFLFFVYLVVRNGFGNRSIAFYLFLYLLINFQTDYTYKIYGLMALFMAFAGSSYKEEKEWEGGWLLGALAIVTYLVFLVVGTNRALVIMGEYGYARAIYPLNKEIYQKIALTERLARKAEWVAPYNVSIVSRVADFYSTAGDKKKAHDLFERLYTLNRYVSFDIIKKLYLLKRDVKSAREAEMFFHEVLMRYREISYLTRGSFEQELHAFCLRVRGKRCWEIN